MAGEATNAHILAKELGCSLRTIYRLRDDGYLQVELLAGRPPDDRRKDLERVGKQEAIRLRPYLEKRSQHKGRNDELLAQQQAKVKPQIQDILDGSWDKLAHDPEAVMRAMPVIVDTIEKLERARLEALDEVERVRYDGLAALEQARKITPNSEKVIYELRQEIIEKDIEITRLTDENARLRYGVF